jgi:hypothetical protein
MLTQETSTHRIAGLAAPYGVFSGRLVGEPPLLEVIQSGAFAHAIKSGRSLRTGKPIFACWGHKRLGRPMNRWHIADTQTGNLHLWDTPEGVFFEIDGVRLPLDFSGVSVKLEPIRRIRESMMARRVVEAGLQHVALLVWPEQAAYEETFLQTIRMS